MGSPMTLKLVLRIIGTPVNLKKAVISLGGGRQNKQHIDRREIESITGGDGDVAEAKGGGARSISRNDGECNRATQRRGFHRQHSGEAMCQTNMTSGKNTTTYEKHTRSQTKQYSKTQNKSVKIA